LPNKAGGDLVGLCAGDGGCKFGIIVAAGKFTRLGKDGIKRSELARIHRRLFEREQSTDEFGQLALFGPGIEPRGHDVFSQMTPLKIRIEAPSTRVSRATHFKSKM
jgi:hypothetical protein